MFDEFRGAIHSYRAQAFQQTKDSTHVVGCKSSKTASRVESILERQLDNDRDKERGTRLIGLLRAGLSFYLTVRSTVRGCWATDGSRAVWRWLGRDEANFNNSDIVVSLVKTVKKVVQSTAVDPRVILSEILDRCRARDVDPRTVAVNIETVQGVDVSNTVEYLRSLDVFHSVWTNRSGAMRRAGLLPLTRVPRVKSNRRQMRLL